jgi:hypothetical protein
MADACAQINPPDSIDDSFQAARQRALERFWLKSTSTGRAECGIREEAEATARAFLQLAELACG